MTVSQQSTTANNRSTRGRTSIASGSANHTRPVEPVAPAATPSTKVPVITITEPPTKDMYSVIDKLSTGHSFLSRPGELKIFPSSAALHGAITAKLAELNVPFFTHPIKKEARFRSVLFGIPHMPIATIVAHLSEHNITAASVDYLLTKQEREKGVSTASLAALESDRLRSYVLEFSSATVKREQVHSIKYINHHVCSWRIFKSGGNGPTLCNRCCMFGHGQRCCGRTPVCSRCAEAHLTSECPSAGKGSKQKFKCINCINNNLNANHCASSPECPSRELYMSRRRQANEARNLKSTSNAPNTRGTNHKHAPRSNSTTRNRAASTSRARTPHSVVIKSKSYADAVSGRRSKATPSQTNAHSQSLFSIEECADLLFGAIEELQCCHSKLDQLKVLTGLLQRCLG